MGTKRTNQTELIKKHLLKRKSIASWQAIELYGCTRLSAKIYDLRNKGFKIATDYVTTKNRYGNPVTFAKYILQK